MVRHDEQDNPRTPGKQASLRVRSRTSTREPMPRSDSRGQTFSLRRVTTTMFVPEKPVGPAPGPFQSIYAILKNSCGSKLFAHWEEADIIYFGVGLNVLLVFIPVSVGILELFSAQHTAKYTIIRSGHSTLLIKATRSFSCVGIDITRFSLRILTRLCSLFPCYNTTRQSKLINKQLSSEA
jgi:hypothetical protein